MAECRNEKFGNYQHADAEKQIAGIQFQAEQSQSFAYGFADNIHRPFDFQAGIRIDVQDGFIADEKVAYGAPFVFA